MSSTTRPATGIVHLGLGAFFRGFGCVYVADAMVASGGDWGILGVSLRNPATRDALATQGWAYTSVTLGAEETLTRRIDVLNGVLVAPEDPGAVLAAMADPGVRIVSLTVTEKGYCHNPATGALNVDHPDVQHDLAHGLPVSAIGYLVRALQLRRDAGTRPFTVLSCDNLPANGQLVRAVVLDMARALDPALADWIEADGRFPSTMVDRITPATTPEDIDRVAALTGARDAAPVMHEPFSQWAVEDNFVAGTRPDLAAAGVEMVADVAAHENMKLRMLNGSHSALAYTGYLAGHQTISDTVADPVFAAYLRALWSEIIPAVTAPEGVELENYAEALFERYANPAIRHRTWQIAMDGSQKLPQRLLGSLRAALVAGRAAPCLNLAVAAWMRYVTGKDEQDAPIDVRDPLAARLRAATQDCANPQEVVAALLAFDEVFPTACTPLFQPALNDAATLLWSKGARRAVKEGRDMIESWRWYGEFDSITLDEVAQTGARGIVTALHDIPYGEVWPQQAIAARKAQLENAGFDWVVVESLPVHERMKRGEGDLSALFGNYRQSIANLAAMGVHTICYNFMPLLDWTRTDLAAPVAGGATCLRFEAVKMAAFEIHMLGRAGAEDDYSDDVRHRAAAWFQQAAEGTRDALLASIMAGMPGAFDRYDVAGLRSALDGYAGIDRAALRANYRRFLQEVGPTADDLGVRLCVHQDDPPRDILGLPRIVSTGDDLDWVLSAYDSPANGITFCAGSLGAHPGNDVPAIAARVAERIHFVHLRNVRKDPDGSFEEAAHLDGDTDMVALVRVILAEEARRRAAGRADHDIPFRPDHGHHMLSDLSRDLIPGYPLIGRLRGLAELRGVIRALEHG